MLATGAWTDRLSSAVRLLPSKGAHLIVAAAALGDPRAAVSVPVGRQWGRFVFAAPVSDGRVLIGLTDDPYDDEELDAPPVSAEDTSFILAAVNRALRTALTERDVIGGFAGIRPLLAAPGDSFDLSRDHALVEDPVTGAIALVGGKLTTYRKMAAEAVDLAVARGGLAAGRSRIRSLPLVGATTPAGGAPAGIPPRLARRCGAEAPQVAALASGRPQLLEPVAEGVPTLGVELLFGAIHEGARSVDDLLDRRTRIGLAPAERERALPAARGAPRGGAASPARSRAAMMPRREACVRERARGEQTLNGGSRAVPWPPEVNGVSAGWLSTRARGAPRRGPRAPGPWGC